MTDEELTRQLNNISSHHYAAMQRDKDALIQFFFSNEYPKLSIETIYHDSDADGISLSLKTFGPTYTFYLGLDNYSNLWFRNDKEAPLLISVAYLQPLRHYINLFLDGKRYPFRRGAAFFISYFIDKVKHLNISDIKSMIEMDKLFKQENDRSGFNEWLLGNSYTSLGNFMHYKTFYPNLSAISKSELMKVWKGEV